MNESDSTPLDSMSEDDSWLDDIAGAAFEALDSGHSPPPPSGPRPREPVEDNLPETIGRYSLHGEIAHGGIGVIV